MRSGVLTGSCCRRRGAISGRPLPERTDFAHVASLCSFIQQVSAPAQIATQRLIWKLINNVRIIAVYIYVYVCIYLHSKRRYCNCQRRGFCPPFRSFLSLYGV